MALYIVKQKKKWNCFGWKNAKITKWSHADKGYTSTYGVKVLKFFIPELQFKDTEYTFRNKLIDLLKELKSVEFVTILVLNSKK